MRTRCFQALFLCAALCAFTGCVVTPLTMSPSTTPLVSQEGGPRTYEILGPTEGKNGFFSLGGLIPFGEVDIEATSRQLAKNSGGDALIDVRYWIRHSNYLVGIYTTLEVEGTVVRFTDSSN